MGDRKLSALSGVRTNVVGSVARLFRARRRAEELDSTTKLAILKRLEAQKVFRTLSEMRVEQSFNEQLFARVFDYRTLLSHEDASFHLLPKNPVGPRRFDDVSIGFFGGNESVVIASAEFKSPGADLDKPQTSGKYGGRTPVEQAFEAVQNLDSCRWVIVSNFREVRLYRRDEPRTLVAVADLHQIRNADELAALCSQFDRRALLGTTSAEVDGATMAQALNEEFPGRPVEPRDGAYRFVVRFTPKGQGPVLALSQIEDRLRSAVVAESTRKAFFAEDATDGSPIVRIRMADGWIWTEGDRDADRLLRIAVSRLGDIVVSLRVALQGNLTLYESKRATMLFIRLCKTMFAAGSLGIGSVSGPGPSRDGFVGMELLDVHSVTLTEGPSNDLKTGKAAADEIVAGDFDGELRLGMITSCAMALADLAIQFRNEDGGVSVATTVLAQEILSSL